MTYLGWNSYESWAMALWIDNDERLSNLFRGYIIHIRRFAGERYDFETEDDFVLRRAEEYIKEYFELRNPLGNRKPDVYSDLLTTALGEVDYREVVKHLMGD